MPKSGRYRHYKGGTYHVLGVAKHSETEECFVVYQSEADQMLWARPLEMFMEEVVVDGVQKPRFTFLET